MTATSAPISFRKSYDLWIGGHEPTTDGDWRWTDGDAFWLGGAAGAGGVPVAGLYSKWDPTEPNNSTAAESCVGIPLNGTTWIDNYCSTYQYFVAKPTPEFDRADIAPSFVAWTHKHGAGALRFPQVAWLRHWTRCSARRPSRGGRSSSAHG